MTPSIASRLTGSALAFVSGFVVGNVGIFVIPAPDRWLWVGFALLLMATGIIGVVLADSQSNFSVWRTVGLEVFAAFTFVPLLAMLTAATTESSVSVWPENPRWSNFFDAWHAEGIITAVTTGVLIAGTSTAVAMALAVPAAYSFARINARGGRIAYGAAGALILLPGVALAGGFMTQLLDWNLWGSWWAAAVAYLAITLPLSLWLCLAAFRHSPWETRELLRSDGARFVTVFRRFYWRALAVPTLAICLAVFFLATNDVVLSAALSVDDNARNLPAALALEWPEASGSTVIALGLLWLLPAFLLVVVVPRRIMSLVGRTNP